MLVPWSWLICMCSADRVNPPLWGWDVAAFYVWMLSHLIAGLVRRAFYACVLIVNDLLHMLRRPSQSFSMKTRCSCFLDMDAKSYVLAALYEGLLTVVWPRQSSSLWDGDVASFYVWMLSHMCWPCTKGFYACALIVAYLHVLRRSLQSPSVRTRCSCFFDMNAKSYNCSLVLYEGLLCLCLDRGLFACASSVESIRHDNWSWRTVLGDWTLLCWPVRRAYSVFVFQISFTTRQHDDYVKDSLRKWTLRCWPVRRAYLVFVFQVRFYDTLRDEQF
jgi:hypothetical protein